MKIVIVGGQGQMGALFLQLLQSQNFEVESFDIDDWQKPSKCQMLAQADWVIVSVPITKTVQTLKKIVPYLRQQAILSDITSVKCVPLQVMLQQHAGPILALHPMFGPNIKPPYTQFNLIACGGRCREKTQPLQTIFTDIGFKVHSLSALEHDELMDVIQACHYFLLDKEQQLLDQSITISDQILYGQRMQVIARYHAEDPQLYRSIIYFDPRRVEQLKQLAVIGQHLLDLLSQPKSLLAQQKILADYWQCSLGQQRMDWNANMARYVFFLLIEMTLVVQKRLSIQQLQSLASPSFQQRLDSMRVLLNMDLSALGEFKAILSSTELFPCSP